MIIYRAMCKEELEKTVGSGRPDFKKRFKWFSHNLEWVKSRVMGGEFNNSKFAKGRYDYLCKFEWDGKKADFMSANEIQFDRRKNPTIIFLGIVR